jgi:hypothetical protein
MSETDKSVCPKCGTSVSKDDTYCKNCGFPLAEFTAQTVTQAQKNELPYVRKFSMVQRISKLFIKPSEAMQDIAAAPDYGGVLAVLIVQCIATMLSFVVVLQKLQFVGTYADEVSSLVFALVGGILLVATPITLVIKWAIKSLLVRYSCDSQSGWSFKTAASVTGYAYVADVVVSIIGIVVLWYFVPTLVVDVSNQEAAQQAMTDWQTKISWLKAFYTLPATVLGLLWKSYLGGLGSHFGTQRRCSVVKGTVVFILLGLIVALIGLAVPGSW